MRMSISVLVADYQCKHKRSWRFYCSWWSKHTGYSVFASSAPGFVDNESPIDGGKSAGDRDCTPPCWLYVGLGVALVLSNCLFAIASLL